MAILASVVAVALVAQTRGERSGTLSIGPTASASPSIDPSAFAPTPLDPLEDGTEIAGDGPLLADAPDITLVTADDQELRSVNIATGDTRRTQLLAGPALGIDPWTLFTVGGSLITNSGNDAVRMTSPDHQRLRLARNHLALPTFDDTSVWVRDSRPTTSFTTLLRLGLDGTIADRIALPPVAQPQVGVGTSVLLSTPSGIHAASGGDVRRITASGQLTAVSADRLAWFDCAADLSCQVVIGTLDDPEQVRVPVAPTDLPAGQFGFSFGRFSPDGRRLALPLFRVDAGESERSAVTIIDTTTGAELARLPERPQAFEGTPLDWSPDSQWLFVASGSRLSAWNADSGELTQLDDTRSSPIRGLAVLSN